ncbi:MAG: hypothetical protein JO316_01870 [Abitibacteriaceae bacterium]|nr:hypothetical protein [Abditibacteriaceae bacterium]
MPTSQSTSTIAPADSKTLQVVSVSLGSASRDHSTHATLLGHEFSIERRGTNGDLVKARQTIQELDGKVAAIGLGGIDLYVVAGDRRYVMRDAARLAAAAKTTPVVDGSGLKNTLERATVQRLQSEGIVDFRGKNVLLVSAVDRFGMAEELVNVGANCVFGDFMFILGMNIPLHQLGTVRKLGGVILPVACRLPFKWLYPTGEKQDAITSTPKHKAFYDAAEIIAGDFLLIRRFLPDRIEGKTILTNTVTSRDIELLKERGARRVITTTPEFEGRSFGTNVMEGVFAALGARTSEEYLKLLEQLNWRPRVVEF